MGGCTDLATTLSLRSSTSKLDVALEVPTLDGFEIGRFLGGGGMGVVFEGRDVVLDRRVALKFIRPDQRDSELARTRLLREAQALARVSHRNIVTLYEVGLAGVDVYIAMELLDGTLRDWIRQPRSWRETVDMFVAVGRGLAAMHERGLVHRDINPSNVFIDRDGTPKIGDFGLVRGADGEAFAAGSGPARLAPTLTAADSVVGTPAYMAPEQRLGADVDARADQYAFCISLYEALAGDLPDGFIRERAVPRPLRAILARGLAGDPDGRYPSTMALLAALERASCSRRWFGLCG